MRRKDVSVLQTKLFYVGSIFAVSFGLVSLMWRFKTVNWILVAFGLAWVVLVTAFAYEIVTRAERLDAIVRSRTYALKQSNRNLNLLLEQLNALHAISYDINQKVELEDVTRAFAGGLFKMLPGVDGVWLWLDPSLLEDEAEPAGGNTPEPTALELAAQAGRNFGMPQVLNPLLADNPLVAGCFDNRSVAVDHNLQGKALAWGWRWLASSRMESFAGLPLQLGGSMLGLLGVFSKQTITAHFVSQLHLSINQLTMALEKARLLKEMRRRADELAAANEELRQLDAMKDWFVSSVSHELRTPLTNIRSFGEILETYEDLSPQQRKEFAATIREESERLSSIITDVLDLARITSGEGELHPGYFDLPSVVAKCCKLFSKEAEERGIVLRHALPGDLPTVFADENGVARVLHNLVANAFKFTPDGGTIAVTVDPVRRSRDGVAHVTVLVTDTGIGIKPKDQPKVFEKFMQVGTRLTEKTPGTGLGLAICREIVEKSNGEIWVQSQPSGGSTFRFTLPLRRAA